MKMAHLKYYRGIAALLLLFVFTACTEVGGYTIDVQGPSIEFEMAFFDAENQQDGLNAASSRRHQATQDAFGDYLPVAKSDSIQAQDIEAFLSEVGQTFNSVVEKAELKNSKMRLLQDTIDFSGVNSFLIKVRKFGKDEFIPFCLTEINTDSDSKQLCVESVYFEPDEVFKLIESGFEAILYARINENGNKPACLQEGIHFEFLSGTIIAVKVKTGALFDFNI
ncbi:MAG: hypothetical protein PHE04_02400 [Bacteroidales bacterium]|nr:hypothetical protein [Bacteroidales bacterium]MDD3430868.1 hypothetical protein [Bacteroidales bacterium]MDD4361610.1 hypothetical protein [Bacteroidales bacterium]MDD4430472.1 hypothetical protein [Bacteroidales bacterium]